MRRLIFLLCSLSLVVLLLPQAVTAHNLCFSQSAFCMDDPFSDYWEGNGGLSVFGYPISAAADEANPDTRMVYRTQWLERNRFEYHPENGGTPYEVLLGLLGKERLTQLGRAINTRETGPIPGCLWFEETGHNVCDQAANRGFKSYWQSHGLSIPGLDAYARSLQLFGLPLTSVATETNANGDTVQTQWFERARFEWHPNNPDEFKVLLGLLGSEVRSIPQPTVLPLPQPTALPLPTATMLPTATPTLTPTPAQRCDPAYPDVCIPPPPPDLDCGDIPYRRFKVLPPDPHRFDRDKDGIGCES